MIWRCREWKSVSSLEHSLEEEEEEDADRTKAKIANRCHGKGRKTEPSALKDPGGGDDKNAAGCRVLAERRMPKTRHATRTCSKAPRATTRVGDHLPSTPHFIELTHQDLWQTGSSLDDWLRPQPRRGGGPAANFSGHSHAAAAS